jgi:hypothetical protein
VFDSGGWNSVQVSELEQKARCSLNHFEVVQLASLASRLNSRFSQGFGISGRGVWETSWTEI